MRRALRRHALDTKRSDAGRGEARCSSPWLVVGGRRRDRLLRLEPHDAGRLARLLRSGPETSTATRSSTSRSRPSPPSGRSSAGTPTGSRTSSTRRDGQWKRETVWDLPAHATVHVTIYNFDGASGLRNPYLRPAAGNGRQPASSSTASRRTRSTRTRRRTRSPCRRSGSSSRSRASPTTRRTSAATRPARCRHAHRTIKFTFHTTTPGHYRWQCFVPCAAGLDRRLRRADADDRLHGRLPQREGLMAADPTAAPAQPTDSTNHGRRVVVAWLVLSAIATPLVAIYVGPHIPPGNASVQAQGQVFDNQVMTAFVTPVICLHGRLLRLRPHPVPRARAARRSSTARRSANDAQIQLLWIVITTAMVLFLAGFGTYELLKDGAGGGQGPNPIAFPAGHQSAFQVQVIGQQWQFTYRYPSLGGFESNQLVLPANTHRRAPRHLARRRPLLLGGRARREGRREPRRRQRRVRARRRARRRSTSAAPSSAGSGTATCSTTAASSAPPQFRALGGAASRRSTPRSSRSWTSRPDRRAVRAHVPPRARRGEPDDRCSRRPAPPLWRRLIGFNLLTGDRARRRRLVRRLVRRPRDRRAEPRLLRRHRLQRAVRLPRLHRRRRRLPRRPRLPQLPVRAAARLPAVAAREGDRRLVALLQPLHRPQGRRHPVPVGHRAVLLHRRPERDADPHRAADARTTRSSRPGRT